MNNATALLTTLAQRQEQDCQRDALDALNDAEALYTLLRHISDILSSPSTSFLLAARIREDLTNADLAGSVATARKLVEFHEQRFHQSSRSASATAPYKRPSIME